MPWTTPVPILIWGIIMLPAAYLFWRKQPEDKLTMFVFLLIFTLINLFCALVINWSILNYWIRLLPAIVTFALITNAIFHYAKYHVPFFPKKTTPRLALLGVGLVLLVGVIFLSYRTLLSLRYSGDHVLALMPLRNGLYVIANGGNGLDGFGMNSHASPLFQVEEPPDRRMAYALDIFRMGIRGNLTARTTSDRSYLKYVGYNDLAYSPCNGEIVYVEDGHPEVEVNQKGAPLGNYLVIRCGESDYFITVANLRNGSIDVKTGEQVSMERLIGRVGNSGTPSIPHLHLFATRGGWKEGEGQPVPMIFPGAFALNKFYVRNDLLISNKAGSDFSQ